MSIDLSVLLHILCDIRCRLGLIFLGLLVPATIITVYFLTDEEVEKEPFILDITSAADVVDNPEKQTFASLSTTEMSWITESYLDSGNVAHRQKFPNRVNPYSLMS